MNANLLFRKSTFLKKVNHTFQFSVVFFIFFMILAYHAHSQTGTQVTLKINNPDFVCSPATVDLTLPAVTEGSDPGLEFSYFMDQATTTPLLTPKSVVGGTYYIKGQRVTPFGVAVLPVIVEVDPIPTTTVIQPTCEVATGTIIVTKPTGMGMTYSIDGLTYINTSGVFNLVNAGVYNVTAKSLAGCVSQIKTETIIEAIPPAPTVIPTQPTCSVSTGSITITAPLETGMTYSIDGLTYTNSTGLFELVSSGTYDVTAKNVGGCISPASKITIDAQPPTPPAPTADITHPTCILATGTITITAPTGTGMTYSIDGLNYTNTTGVFTSIITGNYVLTSKSSVGCISAGSNVTVNAQPATPPAPTANATQPTCFVATGTITVTAPTGVGMTYSIDGATYTNSTGVFNSVNPGIYNVTAKNADGCISTGTSITIISATPDAPTITVVQPDCSTATGTITITAPTETGMTYSIDGLTYTNTTGIFTLVIPGSYNVTAKNLGGCISPITKITIEAQPETPLAPTISPTQPTCSVATGTITITAPIGTGMTYSIDGVAYTNTTGIFTTVIAGNYNVTAKNSAGCISANSSVIIDAQPATPPAPTASATLQPTCAVATGTITITAPTGTGMTYSIDGLTYTNTTGIFTIVSAGNYNVTAKNSDGCISESSSVTINVQPATPPAPTLSVIQPTCDVSTGTITITAPSGIGMTYSIDGLAYTNTTGLFTLVNVGIYNVTAKNADGCISPSTSVTILAATPTAPVVSLIQPTCSVSSGTITITEPKEIGMTYSIDDVTYINIMGIFTLVNEGSYNVTAKSSAGCVSPITRITINTQPATPSAPTVTATLQPTCTLATGTITITAPTGTGMTYSIDGSTYTNAAGVFTTVSAGNYNVTAKSSDGCISVSSSVTINAQPATPPAPTTSIIQPTCAESTGTITVTAPTEAGMTYSIDGNTYTNTTGIFDLVSAGTYNVTAKNADGCISPGTSVTIIAATPVAPTVSAIQPDCSTATGTITVTAPIETGLTYSIDGSTYTNSTGIFTLVVSGTYDVTAKNLIGCISPITKITINAQPVTPLAPSANVTHPTCEVSTGTITVTSPTDPEITYSIDGLTYTNTTGIFNLVSAGNYNITAKNSVGCISAGTSVTINAQPVTPPAPTAIATQPTCSVATGTITVTAPTGAGMTYSIDGTTYINTTGIFAFVIAGDYTVRAKSADGCISLGTSLTILDSTPPTPTASATLQPTCTVATGTITVTAPVEAGISYSIDGLTYANTTGIFTSVVAGTYNVTAKNSGGCISASAIVTINTQPVTPVAPTVTAIQPTCTVSTGTITVTAPSDIDMTYSIDGLTYNNTTGVFTEVEPGTYSITAKSIIGCISASTSATINNIPDVFVPNVFTPNADGIHDLFEINCLNPANYPNAEMQIFNRNGNLIYKNDHYGNPDFWNGRSEHKWNLVNDEVPVGTYYYILKLGNGKVLNGYIFLAK